VLRLQISGMANAFNMGRALSTQAGQIRSVGPALEQAVDEVIRPAIHRSFDYERETEGTPWVPLAEATKFWSYRASRNAGGNPILDVTGNLRRVATSKDIWTFQNQRGIAQVTGLPGAEYGRSHEFGYYNFKAGVDVPARPFMTIGEQSVTRIEEILLDYVSGRLGRAVEGVQAVVDWE